MAEQLFISWFNCYIKQAKLLNERRLIVLSGEESWAMSLIASVERASLTLKDDSSAVLPLSLPSSITRCYIYGDSQYFTANIDKKRYRDKLGSECEMLIFADSQFNLDAFAALSGTLKAGGIAFLIVPKIVNAPCESFYFKRFYSLVKSMPSHTMITQSQQNLRLSLPLISALEEEEPCQPNNTYPLECLTEEQYLAVNAVEKVVTGHRKRPLVLTADRGRGKSSALAIACALLLKKNEHSQFSIIITAPDIQSLSVFFKQLIKSFPSAEHGLNKVIFGKATLRFMAVDQLLKQKIKANLVLVDEAAAIPVYLLEQLINHYHRMVFSSTVHGYEGAGRGFTLKFQQSLDAVCPQWQNFHINDPIRWRQDDPLEKFVFDACLLNAELPILKSTAENKQQVDDNCFDSPVFNRYDSLVFNFIRAEELVNDEELLRKVFAILVTAHYQTKPSDLQLLLDNPHVQLVCLRSSKGLDSDVLAVALLMNEGACQTVDDDDIAAIKNSQRRLRNQFLPQSLFNHCGVEEAFSYRYLRIMRIAVHPQIQQQGIGSKLLKQIVLLGKRQGVDFVGSSFGVNTSLLSFWLKEGFSTIRIGFTKDKASGEHSALLLKTCNDSSSGVSASQLKELLHREFFRSFDYLLLEEYKALPSKLVQMLLQQQKREELTPLSSKDMANVKAFSQGERLYSSCVYSLYLWLKHDLLSETMSYTKSANIDDERDCMVLIARLIQKHDSETVCNQYSLTGKKMLNQVMKNYISSRLHKIK